VECEHGKNDDGSCKDPEVVVDPEEPEVCKFGKNSDGSCKSEYVPPTDVKYIDDEADFPRWAIILIIVIVILLVLCMLLFLCGCCKR